MGLKLTNQKEVLMNIDRYLKAGRFTMSLLTADRANEAVMNELIVDYGSDENGIPYGTNNGFPTDGDGKIKLPRPTLHIRDEDGNKIDIQSEAAIRIKEFMDNFIEVSVERTKYGEPSMWLKLCSDDKGDTTYNKSTINEFYHYIQDNKTELKPYILQTFTDGRRDILMPFMTADKVFYDVSKIIKGEPIKSVDDVIQMLHNLITVVSKNISDNIKTLDDKIKQINNDINNRLDNHDRAIKAINKSMDELNSLYNKLLKDANSITDRLGKGFHRLPYSIKAGEVLKLKFNPLKHGFTPAIDSYEKGADIFASNIFITGEIGMSEIFIDIGSGSHIGIDKLAFYMDKNTSPQVSQPNIRVAQVGAPMPSNIVSYVEQLAIGEYIILFNYDININIWSKYIDYMEITKDVPAEDLSKVMLLVNRNRSFMSDLGMIPIKNSVVTRVSTAFLSNGVSLSDNCTLIAGDKKWHDITADDFSYDMIDVRDISKNNNYLPPREKLSIHTTGIIYDPFIKSISMSSGYFRRGMIAILTFYKKADRSSIIAVINTSIKDRLEHDEMRFGIMNLPCDLSKYSISNGDPYTIQLTAPGYMSSDIMSGEIKFKSIIR